MCGAGRKQPFTPSVQAFRRSTMGVALSEPGLNVVRRLRELEAIAKVASSFTFERSLEAMMGEVARHVVEGAIGSVACIVGASDPATQVATTVLGSYGTPEGFDQMLQRAWRTGGTQIVSSSIQTRRAQVVGLHVVQRPGYEEVREALLRAGWERMAVVPMLYRGFGTGLLMVVYLPEHNPDDEELSFLEAVSDQAAVALENSRLFEQARSLAIVEERQRISRDLHDSVSQSLYAISLGAQTVRELLGANPKAAIEPIDYVVALSSAALSEMRAMIFELRPETLAHEGLAAALRRQAASVEARHQVRVDADLRDEPPLPLAAKEVLYRVGLEALQNAVKHAQASRITVSLSVSSEAVTLRIQDDGRGFTATDSFPGHLGLVSMKERALQAGGTASFESAPGKGCTVSVYVPLGD